MLSVRWWLALTFAGIAAFTALAVAQVSRSQSESALRTKAQELAAGSAVAAAAQISAAAPRTSVAEAAAREARRRNVALFVFDRKGRLVSADQSRGLNVWAVPGLDEVLDHALRGEREVRTTDGGRRIVVALPLRRLDRSALVEVASRPDLVAAASVVRDSIFVAALWATLIGVVAGVLVSAPITIRVRRIAAAAAAIEQGRFDRALEPRFPDELGDLGRAIDSMRRELRRSFASVGTERDRLRALIEQLQEGVIGVNEDLRVVIANRRAGELLGGRLEDGAHLPDPWAASSLVAFAKRLLAGADEATMRVVPEEGYLYRVTGLPATSSTDFCVLIVSDVTERERRERAEREFVANAAHELRTPLTAIGTAVEVLQQGAKDDPDERDRFLDAIERQTARLERLVRALLTLARAQTNGRPLSLEAVPLAPLISEMAAEVGLAPDRVDVAADAVALAHPDLLRQALENLIENARKHASMDGLRVSARRREPNLTLVEVSDTGPGMTRDEAERVVDRFFRNGIRGADGFGLGLSIAREVAHAVGGRLEIQSAPTAGTTVRLLLQAPPEAG